MIETNTIKSGDYSASAVYGQSVDNIGPQQTSAAESGVNFSEILA